MPRPIITLTSLRAAGSAALLGGVLLAGGCATADQPQAPASTGNHAVAVVAVNPAPSTPAAASSTPAIPATPATPANSIKGLPGTLFYRTSPNQDDTDRVLRLSTTGLKAIHAHDINGEVSPDGRQIAWVDDERSNLMISNVDGTHVRRVLTNVAVAGFGPTWSPDGTHLLIGLNDPKSVGIPGILRVADAHFVPLPKVISGYLHYRWSGDGKELFFVTGECVLKHSRPDGSRLTTVPVLGDLNSSINPTSMRACDIVSVNQDGSRFSVDLQSGDEESGDIGGTAIADAVIGTVSGRPLPLHVRGTVLQVLYQPNGNLLVRSAAAGHNTLTLFSASGAVLAAVTEPASVKKLDLLDYTR